MSTHNPESAQLLGPALSVLGLKREQFLPPDAQAVFAGLEPPADIDWVGVPVWQTAYTTALRALAVRRHQDRQAAGNAPGFTEAWAATHLTESAAGAAALQGIAEEAGAPLRRAARSVLVANTILTTPDDELPSTSWTVEDNRSGLQSYVGESLRWFSVSPPAMSEKTRLDRYPQLPNAFLVVSPTASGKTKMAGDWLARQGVGKPLPDGTSPRVLWVTDQQKLIDDCLNPSKTLRRCLPPETNFTSVWEGHKAPEDAAGDVVTITKNSLETEIETGLINPDDFDLVVFDEADIMLGNYRMGVLRRFDECKKLLLTATPSRSERKDLQKLVHHIRPLSLLEAVEENVIVPVRILTYTARDETHAEALAASIALHLFIQDGKKVTAYCQPGGRNAQASRLAEAVRLHASEVLGRELGETIGIDMVGSVRDDSHKVIEHFETKVGAGLLATCSMLGRGWDPFRLDGSIFIGPQGDYIALLQEMGRSFRREPDNPDKIATIVQIKYAPQIGRPDYCAEMAFGFEEVMSGVTLGLEQNRERGEGNGQSPDRAFMRRLAQLPPELQAALAPPGKPLVDLLVAPDDPRYRYYVRPEGYDTPLSDLLEQHPGVPREWFCHNMSKFAYKDPVSGQDTIGVPYALVRSIVPEDGRQADRYYQTDSLALFLSKVVVPKIAEAKALTADALGVRLGVPGTLVEAGARALNIVLTEKTLPAEGGSKAGWRLNKDQIAQITTWINEIPVADSTQTWYSELTRDYKKFAKGYFSRKGIRPELRRHPEDSPANGIGYFVDESDALAMKAEYARIKELMVTHRSITAIAKRTKASRETVLRELTEAERTYLDDPDLTFTPHNTRARPVAHIPNAVADAVEERLTAKLGSTEVPRRVLADLFGISEGRVAQLSGGYLVGRRRLGSYNRVSQAVHHIRALGPLISFYTSGRSRSGGQQLPPELLGVKVDCLPAPGREPTAAQLEYADMVQRTILHIDPALLGPPPETKQPPAAPPPPPPPPPPPAPESSPAVVQGSDWVSAQSIQEGCGADAYTFGLLASRLEVNSSEVQWQDGMVTAMSPYAAEQVGRYSIGMPPQGFLRLRFIATRGNSTPEQAIEAIQQIEREQERRFTDAECTFGRSGTSVEVYFAPSVAGEAVRRLRAASLEENVSTNLIGGPFLKR